MKADAETLQACAARLKAGLAGAGPNAQTIKALRQDVRLLYRKALALDRALAMKAKELGVTDE